MQNDKILEFEGVSVAQVSKKVSGLKDSTMALGPGELVFITPETEYEHTPLCDLAEGLMDPDEGIVRFEGEDWQKMSPSRQGDRRGTIGRVFDFSGWVSNLTIAENMTLSERHHTSRSDAEILVELEQLCHTVGLPSVPTERPDAASVSVLRRCQWVRAFMGDHKLFLLERPEVAAPPAAIPSLEQLVLKALSRNRAVLWMSLDPHILNSNVFRDARRYKICSGQMHPQEGQVPPSP